jgi:hypothetical protein
MLELGFRGLKKEMVVIQVIETCWSHVLDN